MLSATPAVPLCDCNSKGEELPLTSMCQLLCLLFSLSGAQYIIPCKLLSLPKEKEINQKTFPLRKRNKSNFLPNSQDLKCSHNNHIYTWVANDPFKTLSPAMSLFWLVIPIFHFSAEPKIKQYFCLLFHFENILYPTSKINVLDLCF